MGMALPVSGQLYHFRVGLADAQLVAAYRDLDGVAQRRDLSDVDIRPLRDAHVHDSAFERSGAVYARDLYAVAHFGVFECFHMITP